MALLFAGASFERPTFEPPPGDPHDRGITRIRRTTSGTDPPHPVGWTSLSRSRPLSDVFVRPPQAPPIDFARPEATGHRSLATTLPL
jgi:hypothetical protein